MNFKALKLGLLTLVLLNTVACNKKDEKKNPTRRDYLTQGKWQLKSAVAAGGVFDLKSSMNTCQTDNYYIFNLDQSISVDEGASKCSDTALQNSKDGSWSLRNNDAEISISGSAITAGFGSISGNITTLDASLFVVQKDTTIGTFSTTVVITFENKK